MRQQACDILATCAPWQRALTIQQQAVPNFYRLCEELLRGSCSLWPLEESALSLQRNLFSTLFIMADEAAGVAVEKLPFFALVNQCLRSQVTGCDNLLDDEYKSVIPFKLDGSGTRFRSVLTVMTADMVLGRLVAAEIAAGRLAASSGQRLLAAVLAVLIPSGIEEHEEESQTTVQIPSVQVMLEQVHYRKTGLLFEAPLRLAVHMGEACAAQRDQVLQALSVFGIGCQILDDLEDVGDDLLFGKHNIVISAACYGDNADERQRVQNYLTAQRSRSSAIQLSEHLPVARQHCVGLAGHYFQRAERALQHCLPEFSAQHAMALAMLVQASILAQRNNLVVGREL